MNKSSCNDTHFTFLLSFCYYLTPMFLSVKVSHVLEMMPSNSSHAYEVKVSTLQ